MSGSIAGRSFLDELEPPQADAFRALGVLRRYPGGAAIFHQGDDSVSVLILVEGRTKTVVHGPQGREMIVGFSGPGEVLGELATVRGAPRSASVYALEPVRALVVPGSAFEHVLATQPAIALALLRHVAERLAIADDQRLAFAAHDVLGRVARGLVELADRYGDASERGVQITLPLSQDELAAWTASSREGVARAMHVLRQLGWIETSRRRTLIRDLPRLRAYAVPEDAAPGGG